MFPEQRQVTQLQEDIKAFSAAMVGMAKEMVKGDIEKGADEFGKALSSIVNSAHSAPIVFISGATGGNAWNINGLFEPTEEKSSDGRVVYKKRGNDNVIIEHYQGRVWHIKHTSKKGEGGYYAKVEGGCALEACVDRVWDENDMKMWTGAEAEAQASSLDARTHPRNCPSALLLSHAVPSDAL